MNTNTANPTDPTAYVAALVQQQGLPMPAGTTENGEPFWIIGDRRIMWAQMQQIVWQAQQTAAANAGSGGGVEAMPQIPQMSTTPEVKLDQSLEQERMPSPERAAEQQEQKAEQAAEQSASQPQTAAPTSTPKRASTTSPYLGDSPKLQTVDPADPSSMASFYHTNQRGKGNPNSSNTFLATLFGKILRSFFRSAT